MKNNDWNSYQKLNKINAFELKPAFFASKFLQEKSRQNSLVSLASVKRRIYNPLLPSLRKMSRDDVLGKLSHEHSRHTTTLSLSEFVWAFYDNFRNIELTKRSPRGFWRRIALFECSPGSAIPWSGLMSWKLF